MASVNIRELIADSLVMMEKENTFLSVLEQSVLDKYDYIDPRDKAFYKRVLSGTTERKIRIDYILGLFSSTKVNKLKPLVRAVLRSSIYQIIWMDSVPDSAVCNEAVKIIGKRGLAGLKGFVNGVLRKISREKDNIKYPDKKKDYAAYMSIYYSCPQWIVEKLLEDIGKDDTEKMLANSLVERPVSARLRVTGEQEKALIEAWQKIDIEVEEYENMTGAYKLKNVPGIKSLPGYDEGLFTVQDYGSMLVAASAGLCADDTVMDLCAAPGGKSIHAADIIRAFGPDAKGHVFSFDLTEEKCDKIRENCERLNVSNITVSAHDATCFIEEMENKADVVILDAPCSGIGVIGHKSDIKYRLQPEDISSLASIQKNIIDVAVRYVRPGGKLIYSTCTVSKEENSMQRQYILDNYPFSPLDLGEGRTEVNLIPGVDDSDGFYIAGFVKE